MLLSGLGWPSGCVAEGVGDGVALAFPSIALGLVARDEGFSVMCIPLQSCSDWPGGGDGSFGEVVLDLNIFTAKKENTHKHTRTQGGNK